MAEIGYVIGDVKGKTAVIVDDIIDTGGTLARRRPDRARRGRQEGLRGRHAWHLLRQAFETLDASPLAGILVTDTVPLRAGAPDLISQLTCADILADSVRRIFTDDSVSEIFAGENQLF